MSETHRLGRAGEDFAAAFLAQNGYRVVARNYHRKGGEVDIVALEGDVWCFIEVKTRQPGAIDSGIESVHPKKQKMIMRGALRFIQEKGLTAAGARFDVLLVTQSKIGGFSGEVFKDAFELDPYFSY